MKVEFNAPTLKSLKVEVFNNLTYARILLRDNSFLYKAIDKLNVLLEYPEEEYFDRIYEVHDQMRELTKIVLNDDYHSMQTRYASIIWEIVYLFAYYTYRNDPLWQEPFFLYPRNNHCEDVSCGWLRCRQKSQAFGE